MKNAEKLINSVRNRPFLYDQSLQTFRNIEAKNRNWLEVARKVYGRDDKSTVNKVKLQWKSLRDAFVKQQRKRQSATGAIRPYIYEAEMQFLLPHILVKERDETGSQEEELSSKVEVKTEDCSSASGESQTEQETLFTEEYLEDHAVQATRCENNKAHPVDAFFHGVAQTVKQLQPKTIARLKKAVANLVMDAEIEELENNEGKYCS